MGSPAMRAHSDITFLCQDRYRVMTNFNWAIACATIEEYVNTKHQSLEWEAHNNDMAIV